MISRRGNKFVSPGDFKITINEKLAVGSKDRLSVSLLHPDPSSWSWKQEETCHSAKIKHHDDPRKTCRRVTLIQVIQVMRMLAAIGATPVVAKRMA